jgi:SAM-dependent methyltransferase
MFLEMTGLDRATVAETHPVVLDAGCGSGKGALALDAVGFDVRMCDLTPAGIVPAARHLPFREASLWDDLRQQHAAGFVAGGRVDYVYCCDVLEHIPTAFTMLVIARLLEIARTGVFLSIALRPDEAGVWIGESLHKTVEPFVWWRDAIASLGTVREARDLIACGVFFVEPRC